MSSSEENYDLDDISGDESEGYSPVAKKTVSPTRCLWLSLIISHHQSKAASKAPAKPKAKPPAKLKPAPKRPLADVYENADESFLVNDDDDNPGPSAPRPQPAAKNKKSASEIYKKVPRHNA
jgi:DNA topoisomerase-2